MLYQLSYASTSEHPTESRQKLPVNDSKHGQRFKVNTRMRGCAKRTTAPFAPKRKFVTANSPLAEEIRILQRAPRPGRSAMMRVLNDFIPKAAELTTRRRGLFQAARRLAR